MLGQSPGEAPVPGLGWCTHKQVGKGKRKPPVLGDIWDAAERIVNSILLGFLVLPLKTPFWKDPLFMMLASVWIWTQAA